jgi:hypothetical protein
VDPQPVITPRQESRLVSTTFIGPDRVGELYWIWASLHEHHAALEATGKTQMLGKLRDLESSWQAQRRRYERALQSSRAFLVLAEVGTTAVGYAFAVCHSHLVWGEASFLSLEALCVRPTGSGSPSFGSMRLRGHVFLALLLACIQEGQRRGLSQWSADALVANNTIRRHIKRLDGECALIVYRGLIASAARRLDKLRLFEQARLPSSEAVDLSEPATGFRPVTESAVAAGEDSQQQELRGENMTDKTHGTERTQGQETPDLEPHDLEFLRGILRFYPGIKEMLSLVRKVSLAGFPVNSFDDFETALGGPSVTIKVKGQAIPLGIVRRFVPAYYFPIASKTDLIAKVVELRRRAELAAKRRAQSRLKKS